MDKNLLLTSVEMAQFASTGFLRFDNLVPRNSAKPHTKR